MQIILLFWLKISSSGYQTNNLTLYLITRRCQFIFSVYYFDGSSDIACIDVCRFFCALDPSLRVAWAETVNRLLKPDGELLTLIYLISDQEGGPPYNNTVSDYQKVLEPLGFRAVLMEDNELAIKPRKGCEKLGRWKRFAHQSSL